MSLNLLAELVIILAASVCNIFVFHKIKLPPVVGFLLTGILIGPGGLSLVKDTHTVDVMAEVGVVMLLFMVGLEFTLERLKRIQRNFWIGGGLQVVLTVAAAALLLTLLHIPARQAIFYGFLVSLSSTAVVLKILGDRNETDSPQGMISLGILIFQDMAIVPMIAFVPILANVRSAAPTAILVRFLLSAAAIGAVFGIARFLMPRVLHAVVGTRIREMFLISSLLLCLGMSGLTSLLGLSMALGAFLAGVIISESEYSHQVVSDILPFRDLFNSLFFISIGMMLQVGSLVQSVGVVAGLVLLIIVLKAAIVFLTVRLLGYDSRISVLTGLALAQVGEFSFVLAGVGRANDLMPGSVFQIFLASSILTIIATPFLIQISPGLAAKTRDRTERKRRVSDAGEADGRKLKDHVIIAGYGLNGRNLANVLREAGIAFVVVDLNPEAIRIAAERKDPFIFGDASSRTILRAAGIGGAKAVVFAISDPATTRRGVRTARQMERGVYIVVRTLHVAEIEELYGLGADDVIPEEFETSVEIFIHVLERFHIPRNVIDAQVKVIRNECYGLLRGTCEAFRPSAERVADLLSAG
ncbi:MAG: cation:proton antiporter, partial [Acidobacteriota bacterium]